MFEVGQKCYTYKENVQNCTKPRNRKFRHDIVECTIQSMSYDQKFALITWKPNPDNDWVEFSKLALAQTFVSETAARDYLDAQRLDKKEDLPKVGDLVGFMCYEPIDMMRSGYVFRTSCVVRTGKASVNVVSIKEHNKDGPYQYVNMGALVILQRAAPKISKAKSKKKETENEPK
jgi:hypothetical protein